MGRFWAGVSLLAGLAALVWFARANGAPLLTDDAYQYLDAARSWRAGQCLCTHVAHFDEQVAYGRLPAPFTHFPPAYPLLIAAVSRVGFSLETAGFLISAAGFLIALWLIWDIGLTMQARPWAVAAVAALWLTNSRALLDASTVGAEAIFTAAVAGFAAAMVRDVRNDGRRPALLAGLGCLAGVAYDIRYAGLFLIPVAGLYLLWRAWRTPASRGWAAGGIVGAGALAGVTMVRNAIYAGSWRGGNASATHRPLGLVLAETLKSYYHLVFGDAAAARADAWAAVFCASFVVLLIMLCRAWRRRAFRALAPFAPAAMAWVGLLIAAYAAGIVLTGVLTIAADLARYDRPAYPLALALGAVLLSVSLTGRWIAAGVAMAAAIVAIQARSLSAGAPEPPDVWTSALLSQEVQPGMPAREWLLSHVPADGVLAAVDGQAVEYVLRRNVLSAIEPQYSSRRMDEEGYRELMTRERARYLLLFPGASPQEVAEQYAAPFLRDLAAGAPPPSWLREAAGSGSVSIYECDSCAASR